MTIKEKAHLKRNMLLRYNNKLCKVLESHTNKDRVLVWMFHHCKAELIPYGSLKIVSTKNDLPVYEQNVSRFVYYIEVGGFILSKVSTEGGNKFSLIDEKLSHESVRVKVYGTRDEAKLDAELFTKAKIRRHWIKCTL